MSFLQRAAAALLFSLLSTTAFAVPVTTTIGDVDILGTVYSVSLLSDSNGNYGGQSFNALSPSDTFASLADARAAGNALLAAFPNFDWNPTRGGSADGARIIFGVDDLRYDYVTIRTAGGPYGPFTQRRTGGNYFSFAQFTPTASSVPAPAALGLLCVGLIGMRLQRRRQR